MNPHEWPMGHLYRIPAQNLVNMKNRYFVTKCNIGPNYLYF